MGTRNLTKVIDRNGVTKIAQYGQFDGYPEYSGVRILEFISEYDTLDKLEASLEKCHFVKEPDYSFTDTGDYKRDNAVFNAYYPNYSRNTGADILKVVVYSVGDVNLIDESEFENDGLFCEGVYTIDFQKCLFISKYNGVETEHGLENLPSREQYLERFELTTV